MRWLSARLVGLLASPLLISASQPAGEPVRFGTPGDQAFSLLVEQVDIRQLHSGARLRFEEVHRLSLGAVESDGSRTVEQRLLRRSCTGVERLCNVFATVSARVQQDRIVLRIDARGVVLGADQSRTADATASGPDASRDRADALLSEALDGSNVSLASATSLLISEVFRYVGQSVPPVDAAQVDAGERVSATALPDGRVRVHTEGSDPAGTGFSFVMECLVAQNSGLIEQCERTDSVNGAAMRSKQISVRRDPGPVP